MLTPKQVAEQTGDSYAQVLRRICQGEFPKAVNRGGESTGRRYSVPQSDVDHWLDGHRVVPCW